MEKEDHKPKHVCRFCNKRFLCGRSLGGHMRSHIANISEPKLSATNLSSATIGYGLRQKRKKTWRVADPSDDTLLLFCKQCGKGFVSCKALFGHMKSHSHKQISSSNNNNNISQEQDYSSSSSSSSFEQEEVAMSLMMLSRDMRSPWAFQQMGSEKTPKRSKLWDSHHFSRSGFMMNKSKKLDSDHDGDGDDEETESYKKKSKGNHECSICFKIFASGQALGGHKRTHLGVSHSRKDHQSGVLIQEQVRDFNIDLNLPAVIEEDSNNNGGHCDSYRSSPWWVGGGTHKKETLVDLNPLMV